MNNGMSEAPTNIAHSLDVRLCNTDLQLIVENSINVIKDGLLKYGVDNVAIAYNGGKDCTVLLHLLYITLHRLVGRRVEITAICIDTDKVFAEVEEFIQLSVIKYNLNMIKFCGKIKAGLYELHEAKPHIKAVYMGTRLTDPYSANSKTFQPCDKDWPPLVRVNPVLHWEYHHVWEFLRELHLDYCVLYDQGYTSLGTAKNTAKNPALLDSGSGTYRAAYTLSDGTLERVGRT